LTVVELSTKESGPQKQLYVFELYTDEDKEKFEVRKHYGLLSFGDFVTVVETPSRPLAMYPYPRVRSIIVEDVNETGIYQ
jgi:hypothetical protein